MEGKIIAYSNDVAAGVIHGIDGKRYQFSLEHWADSAKKPSARQPVYFTLQSHQVQTVRPVAS